MTTPKTDTALTIQNLTVKLGGHTILKDINFDILPGSTAAIIGPNGAGKSVLIKTILRLIPKTSGEILIFGTPHEQYRHVAPHISYVPQRLEFTQQFPLTVKGLFTLKSARPLGLTNSEEERMHELLDTVGMRGQLKRRITELSGGQLQRALIAYSLMDHPKILFLDEPAAGIDSSGQETIYKLLKRIQKQEHLTLVLISHELDVVMQFADQVLCLNQKLFCSGIPRKVLTNDILERMYGHEVGHFVHDHKHSH